MRQILLVILSVLLPIVLIDLPVISSAMGSINGTYDVLMLVVPLPRTEVFQLLPRSMQQGSSANDTLFDVPSSVMDLVDRDGSLDRAQHHVVLLQMGYQISTGPGPGWIPKFSFNELKIDIPFVRHPGGQTQRPMVYKQTVVFSNPVIKMGSWATGLTSRTARFTPDRTPNNFDEHSQEIEYSAHGFVKAHARRIENPLKPVETVAVYRELAKEWWFGVGTGEKVQRFQFDFDGAEVQPIPYEVEVEINLSAFVANEKGSQQETAAETLRLQGTGWRMRTAFFSIASSAKEVK